MTRNRGNAIVKFIMIIAVAAIIFLALDFWLGSKKDAEEVASGPAPVSESSEDSAAASSSADSAEDQAASTASNEARAAVSSGMTLDEAKELGRSIGEKIGTEVGTEVGKETAMAMVDEALTDEGELVAAVSDEMMDDGATASDSSAADSSSNDSSAPEASTSTAPAEDSAASTPAEPAPAPAPEPEPEPAVVAEAPAPEPVAAPAPPPPPKPKPAPKPSQFWWTGSFVDGGMGVRFVGPYKGSGTGVAVLFTSAVDGGSVADHLALTKGGKSIAANWKVSPKNSQMVFADNVDPGSYTLSIKKGLKSADGKTIKRSSSGIVRVK